MNKQRKNSITCYNTSNPTHPPPLSESFRCVPASWLSSYRRVYIHCHMTCVHRQINNKHKDTMKLVPRCLCTVFLVLSLVCESVTVSCDYLKVSIDFDLIFTIVCYIIISLLIFIDIWKEGHKHNTCFTRPLNSPTCISVY